jgi:Fe-S-cluster containining protein
MNQPPTILSTELKTFGRQTYAVFTVPSSNGKSEYRVDMTNGRCMLLDDQDRCTIYESRPLQCSTYPFWPGFFQDEDDFSFLKNECEGIGRRGGEVFSKLAIRRRTMKTDRDFKELQSGKDKFSL